MKKLIAILFVVIAIIGVYYVTPNINIANYETNVDVGVMTLEEQEVFLSILDAVENQKEKISYDKNVNLCRIMTHIGMYYGSTEHVNKLIMFNDEYIVLDLDEFAEREHNKVLVEARIDEMLSTLKEGSDKFKLFQISIYLAERIVYTTGVREPIDGLNGKGVCATYAMLFYKAASRLGIPAYICYGYADDGYHAWNMVEIDGKQYFYDLTWFDSGIYNFIYLHSTSSWKRNFILNDKWEGAKI